MLILLTRPLAQSQRTAEALKMRGHQTLLEPLLNIEPIEPDMAVEGFNAVLLSSAHGLPFLEQMVAPDARNTMPVLTTGKATAALAEKSGFSNTSHVEGSALELAAQAPDWLASLGLSTSSKLIYPSAEISAHDLQHLLAQKGIRCQQLAVYRAQPTIELSPDCVNALKSGAVDCVFLYSKRTADTFVELMSKHKIPMSGMRCLVLSQAIFDNLPRELQCNAAYPPVPNEQELLKLVDG